MGLPDAVLWDMDGTIVDTEPYWMAAETRMVQAHGGSWSPEQGLQLVGNGLEESAQVLQTAGVVLTTSEIIDSLSDEVTAAINGGTPPFRPGAVELLRALRQAGVRLALVTMSLRRMAEAVVAHLDAGTFDVIVSGDAVARPKPFPDPYLQAAELLGLDIRRCLAFEGSPGGLRAALASGAVTVGVPHMIDLSGLGAHALWPTLAGRGLDDIAALLAEHGALQPEHGGRG